MRKKKTEIGRVDYKAKCYDCTFSRETGADHVRALAFVTHHFRRYPEHRIAWLRIEIITITEPQPETLFDPDEPPF